MTTLPMFPLGAVLFPYMPMQLRVFEPRYLMLLADILSDEPSEFGIPLIERGSEVGGGEHTFGHGTVAQIVELEGLEGFVGMTVQGDRRFEVTEWLDDQPYPRAKVRELPDLEWDDDLEPLRRRAELAVRRTLAVASEYTDQVWSAVVELSDEPVAAAWQLAAITPLNELDQLSLLGSVSMEQLLSSVESLASDAEQTFRSGLME
ncbi:LON peptidase substrate-binding domain-containing protein [Planctomonas psychrotolerans]|uniref:LON peptidase substrate-binding domain-containing protein n=1 Tax=Planctomonas psychrotolerans TaxID=2528712 RepID=UPI00123BED82|nr:LON peptidase substrate-binding domain-containing protein [Planctomonas psychrotolerans]